MANKEVDPKLLPQSWVQMGAHRYQLHVLLNLDGPDAGKYMGMAIKLPQDGTVLVLPMAHYRMGDCWQHLVGLVFNTHCLVASPGVDVRQSIEFAREHGVKSPLR